MNITEQLVTALQDENAALHAKVKRLESALSQYKQHIEPFNFNLPESLKPQAGDCWSKK